MNTKHTLLLLILLALTLPLAALTAGQTTGDALIYLPLLRRPVPPTTTRVSVASDGTQGNAASYFAAISADGRFIAFSSGATNLVPDDSNDICLEYSYGTRTRNCDDVFVHDRQTGTTTRVSLASDGTELSADSYEPAISADGRFVAFCTAGDSAWDVFVHDRQTGETSLVSMTGDDSEPSRSSLMPSISGDGRVVAFYSGANNLVADDTNEAGDIFVHDLQTGVTTRVSVASDGTEGNAPSQSRPVLSADGRFIAFESSASNLVPGDTNDFLDVFVHDRQTGDTTRVSVASDGTQASGYFPSISAGGRFVAFVSDADNLVPGDTNGRDDIFVHDRQTGETARVSVASDGTQADFQKRFVASVAISADGRFVAFTSDATNLVPDDTNDVCCEYIMGVLFCFNCADVFVHDRLTGETTRVSIASDGTEGNDWSGGLGSLSISATGRFVTFYSEATNLVPGDTNNTADIFLRDRGE